jgi:hypothetical protein
MGRKVFRAASPMVLLLAATVLGPSPSWADDSSNYDGTTCEAGQYYNATAQGCEMSVVTNDPNGVPVPQDAGANYNGTECGANQLFDESQQSCVPAAVTNDANTAKQIANGPLDQSLPKAAPQPEQVPSS